MKRRTFLRLAERAGWAGLACTGAEAFGQPTPAFPTKPLRLVVPTAAGGGLDNLARAMADGLSQSLGQPVNVDNRPGAAGFIAAENVAKAPADGHALLFGTMGIMTVNPHLYARLPYRPADFMPVAPIASSPYALFVNSRVLPVRDLNELVAYAKSMHRPLTYGSFGSGSTAHLMTEMVKAATGLEMIQIPYKSVPQATTDLLSGDVMLMIHPPGDLVSFMPEDKVRPLAVTSATRMALLPNVLTLAESGLKGFDVSNWFGIFAPAATPKVIVQRLALDISHVTSQPRLRDTFSLQGLELTTMAPEAFPGYLRTEHDRWGEVIKRYGISLTSS